MARISDIRLSLVEMAARADLSEELRAEVNQLLIGLARHDSMTVASFLQLVARSHSPKADPDVGTLVKSLRDVFQNDDAFRAELRRMQTDRSVPRDALNQVYEALTGRTRKLPTKATKAKLAQDIADYRLERVRSERAAEMFKGKPAYAE